MIARWFWREWRSPSLLITQPRQQYRLYQF